MTTAWVWAGVAFLLVVTILVKRRWARQIDRLRDGPNPTEKGR